MVARYAEVDCLPDVANHARGGSRAWFLRHSLVEHVRDKPVAASRHRRDEPMITWGIPESLAQRRDGLVEIVVLG